MYIFLYFILAIALAVLPTGLLVSKFVFKQDIRNLGSGNPGGTNIWRIYGWKWGLPVILIDAAKSMGVVLLIPSLIIFNALGSNQIFLVATLAGTVAIVLNIFNPLLHFKGGKGIATGIGVLIGLDTFVALITICSFLIICLSYKFKSNNIFKASLTGTTTALVCAIIMGRVISEIILLAMIFLLTFFAHRKNIRNYLQNKKLLT